MMKWTLSGRWLVLVAIVGVMACRDVAAVQNMASARIDRLVFAKLDELGIPPSDPCTDEVFLRRVYLDVIGTLPTEKETRQFLASNSVNKRAELIEKLLERPEFADYWSLKWCDLLRIKAEFPSKLWPNAVQAYYRWIHTALFNNMPYDEFTRQLLTSSGSNFRVAPVNFYRAMPEHEPLEIARIVALTFMGMRTDNWERGQLLGMAAFFGQVGYKGTAEWKEEIVFFDPTMKFTDPETKEPVEARLPNGTVVDLSMGRDPRLDFAEWLIGSDVFAKNIVNRIWCWLLGRGIVHEADDFRDENPPQNAELLDFLAKELVENDCDLRHIYRIILNSRVYQLASIHNEGNAADEVNFSRYYVRRLDAEVLIDAICQITDTTESYSSEIPEPFTFIPQNQRSIKLADGSITSPFLELYGRPPRDTGYESERNNTSSSSQKLHMLNSTHIQQKILNNRALLGVPAGAKGKQNKKRSPATAWRTPEEILERIYLTILSRYPSAEEKRSALDYFESSENRFNAAVDMVWALFNTKEFIYKH